MAQYRLEMPKRLESTCGPTAPCLRIICPAPGK